MTKEEAIEILKTDSCVDCGVGSQSPYVCTFDGHCDIKDAMKMAIKALEQQPSDDCVSRAEVIKTIENFYIPNETPSSHTEHEEYGTLIPKLGLLDEISDLPPVTPTFPKGATNGDILKIIFPNTKWEEIHDLKGNKSIGCTNEFWNAPYKRGDLDGI